ncbi:MAG: sugar phosphate isomerase/epimerase [Firmicutes bacterium]|nr:sugar phosphate isomerase/epimerase [Bacillota bacterium]
MRLSTTLGIHCKSSGKKDKHYSYEDSIRICLDSGYKVLDISFSSHSAGAFRMNQPDWEQSVTQLKEFASALGVEWSQGHAHYYGWETTPESERGWQEELIRRSIIGAGILGVKWLVIHPGSVHDDLGYSREKSLEKNLKAFREYGELAAEHNVGIAIENMFDRGRIRRFGSMLDELLELHEMLDDPVRFGICWDTGHAHLMGINQAEALQRIGGRLKALHIADNRGEYDDHIPPYFGTINWGPIMRTLEDVGYKGDFTFEILNLTKDLPRGLHQEAIEFTYRLGRFMLESV